MRVLVTAGAGFLGSHLCDRLLVEDCAVVCVDSLKTGQKENIAHLLAHSAFEFAQQDITEPFSVDGPVNAILHFASPASPRDYLQHPIHTLKVGGLGTYHALGLAKAKGATFLLASTSEVYGDPEVNPQPESYLGRVNPVGSRSVYDGAKRYAEAMTAAYHRVHAVRIRISRIFNTYGPRMRTNDGRVLPNLMTQALCGEPLTLYGDGLQTRSLCYVSDLVEGIYRLLVAPDLEHHQPWGIQTKSPFGNWRRKSCTSRAVGARLRSAPFRKTTPECAFRTSAKLRKSWVGSRWFRGPKVLGEH